MLDSCPVPSAVLQWYICKTIVPTVGKRGVKSMADNICKGKRYIKAICDKCIKLPYCKPTEKPKFKDLQKLLNGALLKRISAVEKIAEGMGECNTAKDIAVCTFMKRLSAVEDEHKTLIRLLPSRVREIQEGWCCGVDNRLDDLFDKVEKLEARIEDRSNDYHAHISQLVSENKTAHEKLESDIKTKGKCFHIERER